MMRRTFITSAAAAAAAAVLPGTATAGPAPASGGRTVTAIESGFVRGTRDQGVSVFRGLPYAAPPVGELRFASPRPAEPWRGVRDATAFGAPSLQGDYLPDSSEDSLFANVWTPGVRGCRPVIVYIHGGGWFLGAGSEPDYDGARLAARGDVVVVNFNYRLGALGWGLHPDLADPETGHSADWGLQDQAALVQWVRRNAPSFGGDPDNITLCGTSAGGSSTWQLALLPEVRRSIRRIVPISAKHVWTPASSMDPDESAAVYAAIAAELGTTVRGLREVPAGRLKAAWEGVFSGPPAERAFRGGREYQGPVVDGHWMTGHDHALPTPDLPSMPIYARTEGSFFTTGPGYPYDGPMPGDEQELREKVREVLLKGAVEVADSDVEDCLDAYREAADADGLPADPVSLWTEIWGDGLFRYQILRLAERHAREGGAPQYLMEFAHPVKAPNSGTPHEATSKFLFGTHRLPGNSGDYGDGPLERAVSDTFIDLVSSFARDGAPSSPGAPEWPVFEPGSDTAMILGGEDVARVASPPKQRQLGYWDEAGWVPVP